jgi:outer membrane protein assembly factor BamE (lipoprotein component of BamABCDE complex)
MRQRFLKQGVAAKGGAMGKAIRGLKTSLVGAFLLVLAGCVTLYQNHGYAPTDVDLAQVIVGKSTREEVATLVGVPGTSGLLAGGNWYYVQSRFENYAYRAPKEIDRQVVAITFNQAEVVTNVERFGLADGKIVALSRRVTDSGIQGKSALRQIFGALGNFSAANVLGDQPGG